MFGHFLGFNCLAFWCDLLHADAWLLATILVIEGQAFKSGINSFDALESRVDMCYHFLPVTSDQLGSRLADRERTTGVKIRVQYRLP